MNGINFLIAGLRKVDVQTIKHIFIWKSPCSCVSELAVDEILQKNDLAAISESELLKPLDDKGAEEILITDKVDC